ncbi:MAG: dihydroxyacetone kinase subunit DhaK [Caldilineaceae bacterium]
MYCASSWKGSAAHAPDLRIEFEPTYIISADAPIAGQVAVVSGGGSGHEPLHGGFVEAGHAHGHCPGEVSPRPRPTRCTPAARPWTAAGVLFIVKNYTGDVLSFRDGRGTAPWRRRRRAKHLGRRRRGRARQSLLQGGAAWASCSWRRSWARPQPGYDLDQCADLAPGQSERRSMGMALTSCIVPANGKPTFDLGDDEMEIGIGIHGEPGQKRMPLATVDNHRPCSWRTSWTTASTPARRASGIGTLVIGWTSP